LAVDEDLRHRPAACQLEKLLTKERVVVEVDLVVFDPFSIEQRFCADAIAAPGRRIHLNACHAACKTVKAASGFPTRPVPTLGDTVAGRTYKTEAVVLRSLRFGEADRVLHLYTLDRGRVGAVAKGIRRTKSRFGARLEPLSHVELLLHQGGGELATVTGASLVQAHRAAREDPYRRGVALALGSGHPRDRGPARLAPRGGRDLQGRGAGSAPRDHRLVRVPRRLPPADARPARLIARRLRDLPSPPPPLLDLAVDVVN